MAPRAERLPSVLTDRVTSYVACLWDLMIQLELEFAGKLDVERLAKALELTLEAEPVLGCRFVEHWRRPYWERCAQSAREVFALARSEEEYEAFKIASLDAGTGPQLKACLWPSSAGSRLLLKVGHEVADAGGVKDVASTVSRLYARLADNPEYRPEPDLKGSRGLWQVMRHVPRRAYPRIYLNFLRETWSSQVPRATHGLQVI